MTGTVCVYGRSVALFNVDSFALIAFALGVGACARELPAPTYDCLVRVSSDPGMALANVSVLRNGQRVGATNQSGSLRLRLSGVEGETVTLTIQCPAGHRQPTEGVSVILKSVADATHVPEYSFACPPELRRIVVAIRAEQGPNLPVLFLGKELARTDSSGTAHVLLQQAPDSQFELTLGTDEEGAKQLRPHNPSMKFYVRDQDDVMSMLQAFVSKGPPKTKVTIRRAQSSGPIRL